MGLSIEFGLICRDAGKVFIRATSNVIPEGHELKVESQIAGKKRPCLLFLDEAKNNKTDKISWIVVAPQYIKQTLVFSLVDSEGVVTSSQEKTLSLKKAKWLSRYNYRANREAAFEIRNYDTERDFDLVRIDLYECICRCPVTAPRPGS